MHKIYLNNKIFKYIVKGVMQSILITGFLIVICNFIIFLPIKLTLLTLLFFLSIILASAYVSLNERHIVAIIQRRVGPSITGGSFGLLQPLMDGLKLLLKEVIIPNKSNTFWFLFGPIYTFYISLIVWSLITIDIYFYIFIDSTYLTLALISLFVINSHGIIISAWFSNNKFGLLGALRSVSLSVSYGLSLTLIFLGPCFISSSYNLREISISQQGGLLYVLPCLPLAILFWITILTEIKKIPFDVSESEAELGSGYMIEYSSSNFALFVISEYIYIIVLLNLFAILFLGGFIHGIILYIIKLVLLLLFYFIVRSILPNFRFDQIMLLHWKYILPSSLVYVLLIIFIIN